MQKTVFGTTELWSALPSLSPLIFYGTGDGADKIIAEMSRRGLSPDGFFASDGFVRDRYFHGKKVMSLSEAEEKFGDFTVLMAFGSSRAEVMENVGKIMRRHRFFAPDVPVCGGELFDAEFYEKHAGEISLARSLLSDELSKKTFDDIIKYKLSGDVSFLFDCECEKADADALLPHDFTAYIDLGAYTGDTVRDVLSRSRNLKKIVAFEPSEKPFSKLRDFCGGIKNAEFSLFNLCASSCSGEKLLSDGGGRGTKLSDAPSLSGAKPKTVKCAALDNVTDLSGEKLYIKYDVEGEEYAALCGSLRTIKSSDTSLLVSLYHRSADIFSLPIYIRSVLPEHKLYIRKLPGLPAWDVNLYVTK